MARGNQRELARQKNQQKQQELKRSQAAKDKQSNKGLTLEERRQRDADALRAKQQAKAASQQS